MWLKTTLTYLDFQPGGKGEREIESIFSVTFYPLLYPGFGAMNQKSTSTIQGLDRSSDKKKHSATLSILKGYEEAVKGSVVIVH